MEENTITVEKCDRAVAEEYIRTKFARDFGPHMVNDLAAFAAWMRSSGSLRTVVSDGLAFPGEKPAWTNA